MVSGGLASLRFPQREKPDQPGIETGFLKCKSVNFA
jgi:hypothetical protein